VSNPAEPANAHTVVCRSRCSSQQDLSFLSSESESRDPPPMLNARMRWSPIATHSRYFFSRVIPTLIVSFSAPRLTMSECEQIYEVVIVRVVVSMWGEARLGAAQEDLPQHRSYP
jgi:hypothetical protein